MFQINFLPWRKQIKQAKRRRFLFCLMGSLLLALILLVIIYSHFNQEVNIQLKRNEVLQEYHDKITAEKKQYYDIQKQHKLFLDKLKILFTLEQRQKAALIFIGMLPNLIGKNLILKQMVFNDGILDLNLETNNHTSIENFMKKISSLNFFYKSKLNILSAKGDLQKDIINVAVQTKIKTKYHVKAQ